MNMDYNFDDYLNCEGSPLSNAIGDPPVAFDWIGRQTSPSGIPMTALRSATPHTLEIGNKVKVTVTEGTWQHSGVYHVQEVKDFDNGSYNHELIIIHQNMFEGETAKGTWEQVADDTPLTPYYCKPGYHIDPTNSFCLNDLSGCKDGQKKDSLGLCVDEAGTKLPPWAIWAGVGVVGVWLGYYLIKKMGKK